MQAFTLGVYRPVDALLNRRRASSTSLATVKITAASEPLQLTMTVGLLVVPVSDRAREATAAAQNPAALVMPLRVERGRWGRDECREMLF